jgi:hypothetical protein
MTREEAHNLVNYMFDNEHTTVQGPLTSDDLIEPSEGGTDIVTTASTRVLPEGKHVVRTKNSGDRVYLINEKEETRQWVTNERVLEGLGFEFSDVTDIEEDELVKFRMAPALYKVNE